MRGHAIMRQTKALIEAQGYDVIYGDTDSTFVWLKKAHSEDDAARIGRELVSYVNDWWAQSLKQQNPTSALELEFETHFCRFRCRPFAVQIPAVKTLCRDDSGRR